MRYESFANDEFYHVYNRGVDRRTTFRSEKDLVRFCESLRVFNSTEDTGDNISFQRRCERIYPIEQQLVRLHLFALMPNHFHLLPQQAKENGLPEFMHRVGTSFTQYVNRKEKRTGCLFEGPYRAKHVNSESYLLNLTRYFHINPLSLIGINWKEDGIIDQAAAKKFLTSYRWSSFYYYYHGIDVPFLNLSLLNALFSSPEEHLAFILDYQPAQQAEKVDFF